MTARRFAHKIKPGGLSDEDRREIERLSSTLRDAKPGQIARRIGKHPNTVWWFMVTRGLIERTITYTRPLTYQRGGKTVHRYSREHDERIVALRKAGAAPIDIARIVTLEFGVPRNAHGIEVRLLMLAAYHGGPEGDAP